MMLDKNKLDALIQGLMDVLPEGSAPLSEQAKAQARAVLSQKLAHLDCVSRETFDQQTQVLQKTRAKLEALECKVGQLEHATPTSTSEPSDEAKA